MWPLAGLIAYSAFAVWVIWYDGAEVLEGTIASAFLVDMFAPLLSAANLRIVVGATWALQLVFAVIVAFAT